MNGTTARQEAEQILAELPDRISVVIKPSARQNPDDPALVHPAVVQSAVIERPVADNEKVVAFVQLLPGSTVTPSDLTVHAARLLAPYRRPSEIIVMDTLPAASTGKVLKHLLADEARDRVIGRV